MRWEMPPLLSASTRDPVSTQIPTATDRTCGMASVTTRMPFGSTSFRCVTSGVLRSGAGGGRGRDRELLALGDRGLLPQRALAREPDLAVWIDLDHPPRPHVPLPQPAP